MMVDQRDLAVIVGDQMAELLVALVRNAAVLAADRRELALDLLLDDIPVPPGPPVEIAGPVLGQVDLVGMVQVAPGLRRVERMVRVRETGPDAPGRRRYSWGRLAGPFLSMKSIVRSPTQALLCQASGSFEFQVWAASPPVSR